MSEPSQAGAMLRAAREKQGLHIAALAASIKVAPAKLEALEQGRFEALPDATFTRALAQSVCRVLKIDAAPVLALLPAAPGVALEKVDAGLNTPFRDRPGRIDPTEWTIWRQPVFWLVVLLLGGAAAFLLLPPVASLKLPGLGDLASVLPSSGAASAPAAGTTPPAAEAAASSLVETVHSAPAAAAAAPAASAALVAEEPAAAAAAADASLVMLRTSEPSWIEVQDRGGQVLMSRTLVPGESVGVDGDLPFKLKIGNAAATQLSFRGQPVDLAAFTRDNVARVELK